MRFVSYLGVVLFVVSASACGVLKKDSSSDGKVENDSQEQVTVSESQNVEESEKKDFGALALLNGSWRVEKVMCGDEESSTFTQALLKDVVANVLQIDNLRSSRQAIVGECVIQTPHAFFGHVGKAGSVDQAFEIADGPVRCCAKGQLVLTMHPY